MICQEITTEKKYGQAHICGAISFTVRETGGGVISLNCHFDLLLEFFEWPLHDICTLRSAHREFDDVWRVTCTKTVYNVIQMDLCACDST